MENTDSKLVWDLTYNKIKSKHDEVFAVIQDAFTLEEQEKREEALEKFKEGIQLIDNVLNIQVTYPEHEDITWEKAVAMIQTLKKTRGEVLLKITHIQKVDHCEFNEETNETPQTYRDLANALYEMTTSNVDTDGTMEAELIYTCEDVVLYFISPDEKVSSTLQPETLNIHLVDDVGDGENVPRALLQIGDWLYPLIPGVSPCYRSDYGAFILPDINAEMPGSSVGIIPPAHADGDAYDILEAILYSIVGEDKPEKPKRTSDKISDGIVSGASYVSRGLMSGAHKIGNYMNKGTPKLINKINSSEEPATIPKKVTKGMQMAQSATGKAAEVTGYVAHQIGTATVKLGHFLAPHIQKGGTRLLSTGFRMPEEKASAKVNGAMTVAAGAVEGFATVYVGLEHSAGYLATNLRDNTVKVVKHKYGEPAGELATDTMKTLGNVFVAHHNIRIVQPKHFAKRSVKEAGKDMIYQKKDQVNDGAGTSKDREADCSSNGTS